MPESWQPNPDLLITDLGDELVLMHPGRSEMFSLSGSGRALWDRLPAADHELAECLQARYGLDAAQASADARAFLAELSARDLARAG